MMQKTGIYKLIVLIGFWTLGCLAGYAQTLLDLDACLIYGIEQNNRLKSKRLDIRISGEDVTAAIGDFLPTVDASGSLGKRFGRSVDPKTNMYTSSSFVESTVGMNMSLSLFEGFTRINRLRFRKLNKEVSEIEVKASENQLAYQIMEEFFRACLERQMYLLAIEQRQLSDRYHEQMLEYVDLGLRAPSDLQEIKARLQSDIYQETLREKNARLAYLSLKELMNIGTSDTLLIDWDETGDIPLISEGEESAGILYSLSADKLPEFLLMDLREKAARKSYAMAAGAFSPTVSADFSLYSRYYDTAKTEDGRVVPLWTQLDNNMNRYIGIRVAIPIFHRLSRVTRLRQEHHRIRQTEYTNEALRLQLYTEIEETLLSYKAGMEEHQQAKAYLRTATTVLSENEERWKEGMISVFELMEKRNLYIGAKAEVLRTLLQVHLNQRTIKYYKTGTFLLCK